MTGRKILAVDDDRTFLTFIMESLMPHGYEVTCASDGEEAISLLKKESFDGIVLDFYMPEKDGLDVIGSMYRDKNRTPTIMLSSRLEEHYEAAVQGFGIVREVLRKPCTGEKLKDTLERVLGMG